MTTSSHAGEDVGKVYNGVKEFTEWVKVDQNLIVMRDFNVIFGETDFRDKVVKSFGLGDRNKMGDRLIDFCTRNKMIPVNAWFNHHRRRRYTLHERCWEISNANKLISYYTGADVDGDHNL